MPGTIDRGHLATYLGVLIGTIQRHECRNDDLRLVFREFPILGPESTLAARAAPASRAQGLYEPFHWALLGADGPFDLDHILAVARSVGLDAERLARDMEDPSLDALIERNAILANALGVRGTPAFVIGDSMIRGALPLKQFRAAIADARGRAGRRAESERRRLKRAPRHPDRAAAGAGGRGASSEATTVAARR